MSTFLASRICQGVLVSSRMTNTCLPNIGLRSISLKSMTQEEVAPKESYWDKNKRLNRPLSPHLTIYKPQLTSMLSITHRGTGIFLTGVVYAGGLIPFLLPSNFPTFLQSLEVAPSLILLFKFGIAFPFAFHSWNGIRHLFWDMGIGLKIREVYSSGSLVVALALVTSVILTVL
uniref:Succinate dehydrogenase cytochrome b560 subunit, mitochondrial n=1 Tax=Lepeophtheirus salmonis TaxID=72036 RepID=D3PH53_LEPSM|nr:Succinate dehydrogenase cytochrome b560 subunit, mitochondrial [Lepeophtheirus salmonis]